MFCGITLSIFKYHKCADHPRTRGLLKCVAHLCEIGLMSPRPALGDGAYDIGQGVPQFRALGYNYCNSHRRLFTTLLKPQHSNLYVFRVLLAHN